MNSFSRLFMSFVVMALFLPDGSLLADPPERDEPTPAFAAVSAAGIEYLNDPTDCPGLISAETLHNDLDNYTVLDLRSPMTYEMGHIPGAFNVSLANLFNHLINPYIPHDKPYVLVGYTGQTAGVAKTALEMIGFEDVKALNFGMSSWNSSLDRWTSNVGNGLIDPETGEQTGILIPRGFPDLAGGSPDVVLERAMAVLEAGFQGVSYDQIAANLEDYFIINYFGQADFEGQGTAGAPGHIPGAYQFTPYSSLAMDQLLETIPPDMPVVVYGWTGQHSAQLVTYLNMLGYDAYSLKFGANALFYDSLMAHKWSPASMNNFPLSLDDPISAVQPVVAGLFQEVANYPNPFNPSTEIRFRLTRDARVNLEIYDVQGRRLAQPLRKVNLSAGAQSVAFSGRDAAGRPLATGAYLYRLQADGEVRTGRMQLIK